MPLELEHHHIQPQQYDGPSAPENLVWVCPTTHANIHEILREIIRRKGYLSWSEALRTWDDGLNRYAFQVAHDGYARIMAARLAE